MCNIKSFEELIEKYSADEITEHFKICENCKNNFSTELNMLYPDIKINIKIQNHHHYLSYIKKMVLIIPLIIIIFLILPKNKTLYDNDYSHLLNEQDYTEIIDDLNDDDFLNLYYTLKEDL